MNVEFDKSFHKALKKVTQKSLFPKIEEVINECEVANSIKDVSNLKKMRGFTSFYRIRIGDYRIGVEINDQTLTFITIAHRKDIYKNFP